MASDALETLYQTLKQEHMISTAPLLRKARLLRDVIAENYYYFYAENKDLEIDIRDTVYEAHAAVRAGLGFADVEREFDSIYEYILKLQYIIDQHPATIRPAAAVAMSILSSRNSYLRPSPRDQIVSVCDGKVSRLMYQLMSIGYGDTLQIITIIGMKGNGKMTRQLHADPLVVECFNCVAWIRFPQPFDLRSILHDLLKQLFPQNDMMMMMHLSDQQVGEHLCSNLSGVKYFLLLHNVHNTDDWNKLRLFFPDNKNGSAIILTTKHQDVAGDLASLHHQMQCFRENTIMSPRGDQLVFGFHHVVRRMIDLLISPRSPLMIIPIFGITGSGKTTLARQLYENELIADHFDVCLCIHVSQPFDLRSALLALLKQCIPEKEDMMHLSDQELGGYLYKTLMAARRYLIIVDDVCNALSWDKLSEFFPDKQKGCRVILTTRNRSVAYYVANSFDHYQMLPLGEHTSWELLNHVVFGSNDRCPSVLVETGKRIAHNCRGIPLALTMFGRFLRRNISLSFWEDARRILSLVNDGEQVDITKKQQFNLLNPALITSAPIVAGFDRDISQLVEQLTSSVLELQIIPLVGVAGSGKTTLARQVYDHSSIIDSYTLRAWATISQQFHLPSALLGILQCLIPTKMHPESAEELGKDVLKMLRNKRFLIVVDDIWNANAWDKLREFFPDDQNGSRIILTTREWSLANYTKSSSSPHQMQPIDEDASLDLIIHYAFVGKTYGSLDGWKFSDFLDIGRKIARKCNGHPLALTTVGGLLSKSKKTVCAWEQVECSELSMTDEKETEEDPYLKGMAKLFCTDGGQLLDLITGGHHKLQIIPIVGPGDSGKSTLARLIYDRLVCAGSFDIYAWVTSSEQGSQAFLRNLLNSLRKNAKERLSVDHENEFVNDAEVVVHVHKMLYGRRYLVVLDGIKDNNTWDMLFRFFQDSNNGSQIILTAKEWISSGSNRIKPLKVDLYWEFLIQRAFEQDCSSPKKAKIQMQVPEPVLASEKTKVFWKLVWEYISAGESESDLQLDLLSMSYNDLPPLLKPCFLYMAAFPEDSEIKVSKIIKLWISEGLVPLGIQHSNSWEDIAETYLMDLIARNLISACQMKPDGKVKTVRTHDTWWKFCQKKGCEENFMWFKDSEGKNIPENEMKVARVSVQSLSQDTDLTDLDSINSFLCIGRVSRDVDPAMFLCWLKLNVLDVLHFEFTYFPEEILKLYLLSYLAITCHADIPSLTNLGCLKTLVIAKACSLPFQLWWMMHLRHIKCVGTGIWRPPETINSKGWFIRNLQTLSTIPTYLVSENFLRNFPHLRKLGIFCNSLVSTASIDLHILHKLESLKCSSDMSPVTCKFLPYLIYPNCLKRLTVRSCYIHWEDMCCIGKLRCLEQLKLQKCEFVDEVWEMVRGDFSRLIVLKMEDLNLVHWKVDCRALLKLKNLLIRGCRSMRGLPSHIGNIGSLQMLEVDESSPEVLDWAKQIKKEKMKALDDLRVVVHGAC